MLTQDLEREVPALTQLAFDRLLRWLDDGQDSGGASYIEIRRRLVAYFDRRGRLSADTLADETLNRVGRTLETSGSIVVTPPARYCYVVARYVLLEDIRRSRRTVPFDDAHADRDRAIDPRTPAVEAGEGEERRLECLDGCLAQLRPDQRELVVDYYRDAKRRKIERRRALAARLGISLNALAIRACRIRSTLETCVSACCRG